MDFDGVGEDEIRDLACLAEAHQVGVGRNGRALQESAETLQLVVAEATQQWDRGRRVDISVGWYGGVLRNRWLTARQSVLML